MSERCEISANDVKTVRREEDSKFVFVLKFVLVVRRASKSQSDDLNSCECKGLKETMFGHENRYSSFHNFIRVSTVDV
jgi:hypothetical protein